MDQWWAPVNMAMKFWVQMGGERFLISWVTVSFSRSKDPTAWNSLVRLTSSLCPWVREDHYYDTMG
jgi:hypothetical protein